MLNDDEANPYIAGTAFHGYRGDVSAQMKVFAAHRNKDVYFTECSGGQWSPHFGDNLMWDISTLVIWSVRYHAKTVIKWNLALDETYGPREPHSEEGSGCRGVVTIDKTTGRITREIEYYSLGHASKFVRPAARRVASTERPGLDIENVAFINPDGSVVAIVLNPNTFRQNVRLRWKGLSFVYGLPKCSVTTCRWPNEHKAGVQVWITTADQSRLLERQPGTKFQR